MFSLVKIFRLLMTFPRIYQFSFEQKGKSTTKLLCQIKRFLKKDVQTRFFEVRAEQDWTIGDIGVSLSHLVQT